MRVTYGQPNAFCQFMRGLAAASIAIAVVTAGCGSYRAAPGPTTSPVPVGVSVPFQLYTHCGIRFADYKGVRFYADPPLDDGSGNPPRGWGNPFDDGMLTLTGPDTRVFTDRAGNHAVFSTHPQGGVPTIYLCS